MATRQAFATAGPAAGGGRAGGRARPVRPDEHHRLGLESLQTLLGGAVGVTVLGGFLWVAFYAVNHVAGPGAPGFAAMTHCAWKCDIPDIMLPRLRPLPAAAGAAAAEPRALLPTPTERAIKLLGRHVTYQAAPVPGAKPATATRPVLALATLLDAQPPPGALREALQLHQHDVCTAIAAQAAAGADAVAAIAGAGAAAVKVRVTINGHRQHITNVYSTAAADAGKARAGRAWQPKDMKWFDWVIHAPIPPAAANASAKSQAATAAAAAADAAARQGDKRVPLVIDVGADIGWFTFNSANARARVFAFEGVSENVGMIRASLCANPSISSSVTLYPFGLGARNDLCWRLLAGHTRVGQSDTTTCGPKAAAEVEAKTRVGYRSQGSVLVRRLDDLLSDLDEDVQVLKADVEGFEAQILEGATELFTKRNIWYVLMETNEGSIGKDGVQALLQRLHALGYQLSGDGFQGPWFAEDDVLAGRAVLRNVSVFGAKERNVV